MGDQVNVTIVYVSCRDQPEFGWFYDSLELQVRGGDWPALLVVSPNVALIAGPTHATPKPTVWSGPHRVTDHDCWSAANSRNTGIALCRTDFISFIDDRCVLMPGYLDAIRAMMKAKDPYVLCGSYEKRTAMTVERGIIKNGGIVTGQDHRAAYCQKHFPNQQPPFKAPGEWTYGCSVTLPLEWALEVNGWEELCDGMGYEDVFFGMMLANCGHPLYFEPRMKMIEDRTPELSRPTMQRKDKGVSPNDKSHKMVEMLRERKSCLHGFDLRQLREETLAGAPWPAPWGPTTDFFDGKSIAEMTPP